MDRWISIRGCAIPLIMCLITTNGQFWWTLICDSLQFTYWSLTTTMFRILCKDHLVQASTKCKKQCIKSRWRLFSGFESLCMSYRQGYTYAFPSASLERAIRSFLENSYIKHLLIFPTRCFFHTKNNSLTLGINKKAKLSISHVLQWWRVLWKLTCFTSFSDSAGFMLRFRKLWDVNKICK